MKKIISFILIFSIIFSYRIPATQAAAPALALISAAAIGATVLTVSGTQYAQKAGGSYSFNGSHLTREMIAYSNSSITKQTIDQIAAAQGLAQQTGGYFLGKAAQAVFDLEQAYNKGLLNTYANLYNTVKDYFPNNFNPGVGDSIDPSQLGGYSSPACNQSTSFLITEGPYYHYPVSPTIGNDLVYPKPEAWSCSSGYIYHYILEPGTTGYHRYKYVGRWSSEDPSYNPVNLPPVLPSADVSPLSEKIYNDSVSNSAVAQDLDRLMKDHPELWSFPDAAALPENYPSGTPISDYPPAWPITPSQIQQWSASNSIAAQQALVDDLQARVDANPDDLGLQTSLSQAKAKLEQMQATSVGDLAQSEQLEAEKAEDLEISEPAVPDLELKSINLEPIKETQGIMMDKFPFSVLSAAGSLFSVLVAPPLAPTFVIDLGITSVTIDLSKFDVFASNIRAVMSFLIYGLCGYTCLRIWSRF